MRVAVYHPRGARDDAAVQAVAVRGPCSLCTREATVAIVAAVHGVWTLTRFCGVHRADHDALAAVFAVLAAVNALETYTLEVAVALTTTSSQDLDRLHTPTRSSEPS